MAILEPDDSEKLLQWSVLFVVDPNPILKCECRRLTKQYEHHWHALVRTARTDPMFFYARPNPIYL